MSTMCPACSGLIKKMPDCPHCGKQMEDSGPATDYFGPYSPYYNLHFESGLCTHLFSCPECGFDRRLAIKVENV